LSEVTAGGLYEFLERVVGFHFFSS
jgi:hypothetical protein